MRYLFAFVLMFSTALSQGQDEGTRLVIRGVGEANLFSELDDAVAHGGLGLEAKISNRWTLAADAMWGGFEEVDVFTVRPELRLYVKRAFRGLFLKGGVGYFQFEDTNESFLPFPFDEDEGSQASFLTLHTGAGFTTMVLDNLNVGFHLNLGAALHGDVEAYFGAGVNVGYGF